MVTTRNTGARRALNRLLALAAPAATPATPRFAPPELPRGVVPEGRVAGVAMDYAPLAYDFLGGMNTGFTPFPGYPHLANLTTRGEYRQLASTMATELTREWIELSSTDDEADDKTAPRIAELEKAIERFKLKGLFHMAATHDCFFGRGQIFINLVGQDRQVPLVLSPATIPIGSLKSFTTVEAMWTTPSAYNALDPAAPDFYRPTNWFMLGQEVHASRLLTIITRPLPDMLKPAYNFSGMSLSQIAEPYVNNWLRTRQSVADLINNFSTTALATSMDQVLQGNDDGQDIFARADLFTATRSNKGIMLLDKDREELVQVNTPLGGLHELQAQAQEHLCSISRTPAIILTGISPSGLNASSEGEIRVFYDWVSAIQEAYYLDPLVICIKVIMLHLWGEIDDSINVTFKPLWQMSPQEDAAIRLSDAQTDAIYLDRSVVDGEEVREKLARDPNSGWDGLDTSKVILPEPDSSITGDEWHEEDHPRADNGEFGNSSIGAKPKIESGHVYRYLAKKEDAGGGRSAVEKAASELIANQPELKNEVLRGVGELGYAPSQKTTAVKPIKSEVSSEFGEPEYVPAWRVKPLHEVRDNRKLDDLVEKMQTEGWQGHPILTVELGQGPEALTGSHRIRAAKRAGVMIPTISLDPSIANYEDKNGKTVRDAMWWYAGNIADYLEKAGEPKAAKLMRAEHEAREKGEW